MNPEYMKEIFQKAAFFTHRSLNLELNENHSTTYGSKSLRYPGKSKMTRFSYLELPSKWNLKKNMISRNLLTIGLAGSADVIYVLFLPKYGNSSFILTNTTSDLTCLVKNSFLFFAQLNYLCLLICLLSLFIIELYIYIFLMILVIREKIKL